MKCKRILALLLLLLLLPSLALAQTMYVVTPNKKSVNMRSGPTLEDPVIVQIPYGEAVTNHNDFVGSSFLHCSYKGHNGYIMARYLSTAKPKPTPKPVNPTPKPTAQPTSMFDGFAPQVYLASVKPSNPSTYVNLRWGPSKSTPVQCVYYAGQTLLVLASNGSWCQVYDLNSHVSGFMMSSFLVYSSPYDPGAVGAQQ